MKNFKEVDADRRKHRDEDKNTVHRSSLMVPEIKGTRAEISFLNHFKLKRGCEDVGCRITAIDPAGNRIESRLTHVRENRVYTIPLTGMVDKPVSQYLVEFYSPKNIFVPFPAVMINHSGPGFLNQIHSYNRVLNDIFEDDAINKVHVREASIDFEISADTDTFLVFCAGIQRCQGALEIEVSTANKKYETSYKIDVPRFGTLNLRVSKIFPDFPRGTDGILKVRQPKQFMFYSRILAGKIKSDGSFSGNHSYYDSSAVEEYWDDSASAAQIYPFFSELENKIRMYPIMSPSQLEISVQLYSKKGAFLKAVAVGSVTSPSNKYLDVDVNQLARESKLNINDVGVFRVEATSPNGRIPTRVNHQVVYGAGSGGLESSINVSLVSAKQVYVPDSKTGFAWGQVAVGKSYESFLGIVADMTYINSTAPLEFELKLYSVDGEVATRKYEISHRGSVCLDIKKEFSKELATVLPDQNHSFVWFTATSSRPVMHAFSVWRHVESRHCSGEHSF